MGSILILRLSSLGDILLTQPVAGHLDARGFEVDLAVKPAFRDLAGLLPGVKRLVTPEECPGNTYDAVLDLHATWRARRLARTVRANRVLHYRKHSCRRRLLVRPAGHPVFWNAWARGETRERVLDWYGAAVTRLGQGRPSGWPRILAPESVVRKMGERLRGWGWNGEQPLVVLFPGARWGTKRWPVGHFAEIARRIFREAGAWVALAGGHGDEEAGRDILAQAGVPGINAAGRTTLPELAGMLAHARLAVANDSGPMHFSLAAGVRTLAFLGPTVPEFGFAPEGHPLARLLSLDLPCRPCSLHGSQRCPLGHHRCLRGIGPEAVMSEVLKMLAG